MTLDDGPPLCLVKLTWVSLRRMEPVISILLFHANQSWTTCQISATINFLRRIEIHPKPSWAIVHRSIILLLTISLVALLLTGFLLGTRTLLHFFGSNVELKILPPKTYGLAWKPESIVFVIPLINIRPGSRKCMEIHGKVLFTDFC